MPLLSRLGSGSNENSTKSFSIYVFDILSEIINEWDLLENLHNKQDLQDINIKKDNKEKEGNIRLVSFGTEKPTETTIRENNKTWQHTSKKLG